MMHVSQKVYYNHEKKHMVERDLPKNSSEKPPVGIEIPVPTGDKENEKPLAGIEIPAIALRSLVTQMDSIDLEPVSDEELVLVAVAPPAKKEEAKQEEARKPPPLNKNGYCLPSER